MSNHDLILSVPTPARPWRERLGSAMPLLVLGPSLVASFVYVFVFTGWTLYISLSNSSLLPTYGFVGLDNYASLWANRRWNIAYNNLFFFSAFYIVGSMAVGLLLAILIDQRVRGEAAWRTIFLYPLAVSFIVTGTVWSWLYNPTDGIQAMVRGFGWTSFSFALASDRHYAIYAVIITGVWQASGFAMALFLAGLRSVDQDLVKAAQIDGASTFRIYRKVLLPTIAPIFLAVAVIQIQFAIKTFDLVAALTKGGPGISTTFPAIYVYDLMFQRGQIGEGAAAAIMMLAAVAVVLVPYSFWVVWRRRKEAGHG
ncbi:sugar ABC transporter permease [Mesorhizobium sp. M0761]|uniref:carbohydrate ABC transporter permease n=1 Tax=unclassified Mesorhizobium TaxID=325217 RepID=UPI0003CEE8D7|nr:MULTISPECIES: sugar ABC transporter permease [unclassified Mesorhizobium]ESX20892.1 ABC transporter permease [Mesorhizobium sp. LSJC255A00]ESX31848.1 ABC transporter permease [Mesorhizobium sp. LSHC440B00]ESX39434.1 ABC transporter permease [Mesorhizobium sp. LSHC432A00]ESX78901.1 ABC transporter permease [Mesorhizobium sp. LSHC414A00]ESY21719.1 ABC transporter permease [Mesorhizobium sp. LNJC395A00]